MEQFQHIAERVKSLLAASQPVISVDTKKKELAGPFKNNGKELRPEGDPEQVRIHDFPIPQLGRAATMTHRRSPWKRSGAGGTAWLNRSPAMPSNS